MFGGEDVLQKELKGGPTHSQENFGVRRLLVRHWSDSQRGCPDTRQTSLPDLNRWSQRGFGPSWTGYWTHSGPSHRPRSSVYVTVVLSFRHSPSLRFIPTSPSVQVHGLPTGTPVVLRPGPARSVLSKGLSQPPSGTPLSNLRDPLVPCHRLLCPTLYKFPSFRV